MKLNKKIMVLSAWSLAGIGLVILLGFSGHKQQQQQCKGLRIRVSDHTGHFFIEPKDIIDVLNSKAGKVKGSRMKDINTALLEKIVYTNQFVQKAEVYSSVDGYVNIDVWQRNPIMRIVNADNEHFYLDDAGAYMPVSEKYTCPVVVASGFIFDTSSEKNLDYCISIPGKPDAKPLMKQLNDIAVFLHNNKFWDDQIEQVYVNEKSEIELVPRVGNHNILLGNTDELEMKMTNLFMFYKQGMIKAGWDSYSKINLKYTNQIICTHR